MPRNIVELIEENIPEKKEPIIIRAFGPVHPY
jgi:hypothetical protein